MNEADRLMAIKSFRNRQERIKSERRAVILLSALALAEILAVLIFVIY